MGRFAVLFALSETVKVFKRISKGMNLQSRSTLDKTSMAKHIHRIINIMMSVSPI